MPRKHDSSHLFTDELRSRSRQAHSASDALVNARLVVLFTDRALYARALACFFFVFKTLEEVLVPAVKAEADVGRFADVLPQLYRRDAFAADLEYYLGGNWLSKVRRTPAIQQYEQHLQALAEREPRLLLSHAYTQYMAITAGGAIIRRLARKQMALPEDKGTAAFEFEPGVSASALTAALKARMNQLAEALPPDARGRLLEEHVAAFRYNNAIIRTFRVGWTPFLRGLYVLLLRNLMVVILLLGAILALLASLVLWPKSGQSAASMPATLTRASVASVDGSGS